MTERFEIKLSSEWRKELAELSAETGLTAADLARLGIKWMLEHRDTLIRGPIGERT